MNVGTSFRHQRLNLLPSSRDHAFASTSPMCAELFRRCHADLFTRAATKRPTFTSDSPTFADLSEAPAEQISPCGVDSRFSLRSASVTMTLR